MSGFKSKIIYVFYTFSLVLFFNFSSVFLLWLLMEINLIIFIMMLYISSNSVDLSFFAESFHYFLFQSMGTFLFLICCMLEFSYSILSSILVMVAASLKMGVPPFHGWILKLSSLLSNIQFFILMGPQKIPMFIVFFMWDTWYMYMFLALSSFLSCLLLYNSTLLKDLLIYSSFCSLIWFYLSLDLSYNFFFFFYSIYMMVLMILLYNVNSMGIFLYCLNSSGVPPAGFFFMKMYLVLEFFKSTHFFYNTIIWSISFVSLLGYFKFFWIFLHLKQKIFFDFSYLMEKKFFILPFFLSLSLMLLL